MVWTVPRGRWALVAGSRVRGMRNGSWCNYRTKKKAVTCMQWVRSYFKLHPDEWRLEFLDTKSDVASPLN